jgi:hypothetical protein
MSFEEAVEAIALLSGERVDVRIWGHAEDSHPFASLCGTLKRGDLLEETPPDANTARVKAVGFQVGSEPENHLNLWPDRYLRAIRHESPDAVEVITRDAVMMIARRQPWID